MDDVKVWGEVHRDLPSKATNSTNGPVHFTQRGEVVTSPIAGSKMYAVCDEGQYFLATNPTRGTGIAGHAAPTDVTVDTKPLVLIRNAASSSTDTRVYLDYIRLQATVAGAGATNQLWAACLDTGATRYSSGGSTITAVNPNMAATTSPAATVYVGAVTAGAATSSQRIIGSGNLRTVVHVVGDVFTFRFGESVKSEGSMIVAGTAIANLSVQMPPVVLGPTDQFLLHFAAASQSGAHSYEVQIGWYER